MELLFKLLGTFIGLYCLRVGNISLVFFPLLLIILLNFLKKIRINNNIMIIYYILIFISIFVGLRYDKLFYINLRSFETIRIVIFLYIAIFLKIENTYINEFLKGMKYTITLNLVWGTAEFIFWNFKNFSLNTYIFGEILKIQVDHSWLNLRDNNIRVCGFSWDPLNLGILASTGYFLYENKWMKYYSLVILYLTGSRAGQLGLILALLFSYVFKNTIKLNIKEIIKRYTLIIILIILGVGIYIIKIQNISVTGDLRRKAYYISAVKTTLMNNKLDSFLFGGSPFFSGNILNSNKKLVKETFISKKMQQLNWKIESDWAHILTGRGWIGIISYFTIFLISYLKIRNKKLVVSKIVLFLYKSINKSYNFCFLLFV